MATDYSKTIVDHFLDQMDQGTRDLRHCALYDLYFGPNSAEYYAESAGMKDWPGYTRAVEALEEWARLYLTAVWVDEEGHVLSVKPLEADSRYVYADKQDVARIVFGALISDGGMKI